MRKKIGVAITTYNRADAVLEQIAAIRRLSISDIELVACDDGSHDGTRERLAAEGVTCLGGLNRGIAWNKNRGIFYLFNTIGVDVAILMDDDIVPTIHAWEIEWREAALRYGHINFLAPGQNLTGGGLTAENVGIASNLGGPCMAISREAFASVGYMDSRFGRYGHEHTDYTTRFIRAGYGGFMKPGGIGRTTYFYVIKGGLHLIPMPSNGTEEDVRKNLEIMLQVEHDPIFRLPWTTDGQRLEFLHEFERFSTQRSPDIENIALGFDEDAYLEANPDVRKASMRALQHYLTFGRHEGRRLRPD